MNFCFNYESVLFFLILNFYHSAWRLKLFYFSFKESKDSPDVESNKLAISPHINKFLTREPPDGCEKVKIEETR